ncbi:hypothetical protein F7725_013177 [Dissostichus mawsoni]|uniref:Uncharacterized protein n=1 Tax=Dissostichus mawsoni TaxID=36200 RepID=A0A7J5YPT2_DISMA|nr:hypothetical protein F7725_013177 [Dissostichus mawsoni]
MHTRGHLKETIFLCGIFLLFSSKTAGQTCRGQCGDVLEKCSCHATCVSLLKCCADYNQLCFKVTPHSSSMLGGRALRILGVALHPGGRLLCRFVSTTTADGEIEREGFIDDEGHGYCISPLLYETGWIPFTVSIDGIHFDRSGEFLSVHPSKADPAFEVILVNKTQWQYYGTPNVSGRLKMTWNSSLIGAETVNLELWGYREFSRSTEAGVNGSSSLQAELSYLYSLGRNLPNTGAFSFVPSPQRTTLTGSWETFASLLVLSQMELEGLWSGGHVLAWHLEQAFRDESAAWARSRCLQWDVLENKLPNFLEELITCSVHCVRAIQASPTHGSGQQCCYDSTGALVLTGDSIGGSTPDRAHDWGSPPYREPPRVPGYSHWLYDVMSFYYCCLWSDHCNIYFNHRPSSGCRSYQPPKAGVVLGDPHFVTFDGLSYTFNGKGEYYLVSSPDRELSVQARTEVLKFKNGECTFDGNTSDVIEVRLADGHLQVLRNQKVLPFTEQRWMDLHGVFVFTPSLQNVTVIFLSGVGVEVRVREGAMAVTVLLPSEFTNHTQGLLGLMNSDPSDDLLTGLGEILSPADATPEEIFTFGAGSMILPLFPPFLYPRHPMTL